MNACDEIMNAGRLDLPGMRKNKKIPKLVKEKGSDSARGYCSLTGENVCPLSYLVTTLDQTR